MPGEEAKKVDPKQTPIKEEAKKMESRNERVEAPKVDQKVDPKLQDAKNKLEQSMDNKKDAMYEGEGEGEERKDDYVNFGGAGDDEDPYANDEETYKEHFRKTFITQDKNKKEQVSLYTLHDMMIPAGRTAKLVRVPDPFVEDFRVTEPLDKLKFVDPTPVIILAGAMTERAGKVLAGVARAAFRAGAVIIDSGICTGIEKFCMRKSVPLIGVCPENEISYPVNSSNKKDNELTNGHTHFFLIGSDESKKKFKWGQEAKLKADIAKRIAQGRTKYGRSFVCKIITILVGDNPNCVDDLQQASENKFPIIVLEGSQMCSDIIAEKGGLPDDEENQEEEKKAQAEEGEEEDNIGGKRKPEKEAPSAKEIRNQALKQIVSDEKMYLCKQNSEHIANIAHLLLTITL